MERVFTAVRPDGSDMTPTLMAFADECGLQRLVPNRFSLLLLLSLFGGARSEMQDPAKIIYEIEALEGRQSSQCKGPLPFKNGPLKGLMHQHYRRDGLASMACNLRAAMNEYGMAPTFKRKMREARSSGIESTVSVDDVPILAGEIVSGNLLRRMRDAKMTGEWIIYARHRHQNYYLALGRHEDDAAEIRQRIDAICCREFTFLPRLLPPLGP